MPIAPLITQTQHASWSKRVEMLLQILMSGLAMGSIYGLVALGFVLLVNAADIINFAQGEFVMLGAFLVFTFAEICGDCRSSPRWLLVIVVMGLFGLVMERVAYRPLRNTNAVTIIISTLGISVFLQNVALRTWGSVPEYFGQPFGRQMLNSASLRLVAPAPADPRRQRGGLVLRAALVLPAHPLGKLMRATAQDKETARLLGVNIGANDRAHLRPRRRASAAWPASCSRRSSTSRSRWACGSASRPSWRASSAAGAASPARSRAGLLIGLVEVLAAAYISSLYKDVFAFVVLILFLVADAAGHLRREGGAEGMSERTGIRESGVESRPKDPGPRTQHSLSPQSSALNPLGSRPHCSCVWSPLMSRPATTASSC